MFCWNCGTQFADGTNFCPKCGKPQTQVSRANDPIQIQVEEPIWEVCEIVFDSVFLAKLNGFFDAVAIGPSGMYSARKVTLPAYIKPEKEDKYQFLLATYYQGIIKLLVSDGWQPTGAKGAHWWSDKFQRRVTSEQQESEECEILTIWASAKFFDFSVKFVACLIGRGVNPGEIKIVAESQPFKHLDDLRTEESKTKPEVIDIHHSFVEQLRRDGWDLKNTVGDIWYSRQFRRRITK